MLPIPHRNILRPQIEGAVTLDGRPWADARIVYSGDRQTCAAVGEAAATDAQGRFRLPALKKRKWVVVAPLAPLHRIWTAAVCVEFEGALRPVFVIEEYGLAYDFLQEGIGELPRQFRVDCALTSEALRGDIDLSGCRSDPEYRLPSPGKTAATDQGRPGRRPY